MVSNRYGEENSSTKTKNEAPRHKAQKGEAKRWSGSSE